MASWLALLLVMADGDLDAANRLDEAAHAALTAAEPARADKLWEKAYTEVLDAFGRAAYSRLRPFRDARSSGLPNLIHPAAQAALDRLIEIREGAALAFAAHGESSRAIYWAVGKSRIGYMDSSKVEVLAEVARSHGHDDADYYRWLVQDNARREVLAQKRRRAHRAAQMRNGLLLVLFLAITSLVLWVVFRSHLRDLRTLPVRDRADQLMVLQLLSEDAAGAPTSYKTTTFAQTRTDVTRWGLRASAAAALFGVCVFLPFFWKEADNGPLAAILGVLVWLLASYVLLIVFLDQTGPSTKTTLRVELLDHGLQMFTRAGLLLPDTQSDFFFWAEVGSVRLVCRELSTNQGTTVVGQSRPGISVYQVLIDTQVDGHGRQICVGGDTRPDELRRMGEVLAQRIRRSLSDETASS